MKTKKPRIGIIGFGGTIAMVPGPDGILKPAKSIKEILDIVPSLSEMAEVEFEEMENRDSTNINPSHWTKLTLRIGEIVKVAQYDGLIITHGTDTMAYTSSAVSLALSSGLPIPIVFTGSQLPLVTYGTDARFNLENSMKTVLRALEEDIREVMIVFSDRVLRASRAIKSSESKFTAFESPAFPYLGLITAVGISFIPQALKRKEKEGFNIKPHFQRGILSIDLVPGLEPGMIIEVLRSGKCQGLLFKSLGSGNVPSEDEYSLIPVIRDAVEKYKVPVLVSTKFVGGQTHMDIYEPGKLALEAGAIPTGDMTDVMSQVKFMWALAQGYRSSEQLNSIINRSLVGEISS